MKTRDPLHDLAVDRNSPEPLHRQLAGGLRRAIRAGDLPVGGAMPSSGALARKLGLPRNTVIAAYEELISEDLPAARQGSATRVRCARLRETRPDWRALVRAAHAASRAFNMPYFHR